MRRALSEYPGGSQVKIQGVEGCHKCRCRLCAMGLTPGVTVEIRSNANGSCALKVRDSDIAIDKCMAENVLVCPILEADALPAE